MFGVVLTPPVTSGSLFGALFFDRSSFKAACGHGSIALASAAIEQGWIAHNDRDDLTIHLDVPAGRVSLMAKLRGGRAVEVRYLHVPCHMLDRSLRTRRAAGGVNVELVRAGALVALVDLHGTGLTPTVADIPHLRDLYHEIRSYEQPIAVGGRHIDIRRDVEVIQFYIDHPQTDPDIVYDSVTLFGDGAFDRSPCGVGTSARLAQLWAKGRINQGTRVKAISAIGSAFVGEIAELRPDVGQHVIVPLIRGRAFPISKQELVLDDDDPFPEGFDAVRSDSQATR
jgi:proline racemase